MNIGILYIATGRYSVFWEDFYKSAEKYFLPEDKKFYYIFSDYEGKFYDEDRDNITRVFQEKLGWPYDTLMRFNMFLKIKEELLKMDYLFFFNANMEIVQVISRDELNISKKNDACLIAALHPRFYFISNNIKFPYDRNEKSTAYIPYGDGYCYVMGGLNGGKTLDYIKMIEELNSNTHIDLNNNIIALWHDESHFNKYFIDNSDKFILLSEKYGVDEVNSYPLFSFSNKQYSENFIKNNGIKIIIRDKTHPRFGGHAWLRGLTDDKKTDNFQYYVFAFKERVKNTIKVELFNKFIK